MKAKVITTGANHAETQNLKGWCLNSTDAVLRLRKKIVTGDIIALVNCAVAGAAIQVLPEALASEEGTYVELVSGTLTEGYLWY